MPMGQSAGNILAIPPIRHQALLYRGVAAG